MAGPTTIHGIMIGGARAPGGGAVASKLPNAGVDQRQLQESPHDLCCGVWAAEHSRGRPGAGSSAIAAAVRGGGGASNPSWRHVQGQCALNGVAASSGDMGMLRLPQPRRGISRGQAAAAGVVLIGLPSVKRVWQACRVGLWLWRGTSMESSRAGCSTGGLTRAGALAACAAPPAQVHAAATGGVWLRWLGMEQACEACRLGQASGSGWGTHLGKRSR